MDFMTAVRTCLLKKYMDFSGRARRSEYWWFALFTVVVNSVITYGLGAILGAGIAGILGLIFLLAVLLPSIAVGVRRMHDIGKSGWFLLLALIPLVGLIVIWWFIQPGTSGANEYGADPLA